LKDVGFTPKELTASGFTSDNLVEAGYTLRQLQADGIDPQELKGIFKFY